MNNIISVARDKDDILSGPKLVCPACNEVWYSGFDKLYISAFGKCYLCTPEEEADTNGKQVFQII